MYTCMQSIHVYVYTTYTCIQRIQRIQHIHVYNVYGLDLSLSSIEVGSDLQPFLFLQPFIHHDCDDERC